jgi:nucleotide-binding universal stress UspA family protein
MGTILVATDFSACSSAVVRLAAALARGQGASLLLLHVVERPPLEVAMLPAAVADWELELLNVAEAELARIAGALGQSQVSVETRATIGTPARIVLDTAREIGAQLIVLGTHGRRGAAHLFLGSVAERVVQASACPVLVTREGATVDGRWDGGRSLRLAVLADGGSASDAAFYWIRTEGQALSGDVALIRLYSPEQEGARYGIEEPWPGERGHAELLRVLERDLRRDARALAGAHDPQIRFRAALGDGIDAVAHDARELGADALVLGISKHAGSLAPARPAAILRAATVPVFCVPEGMRSSGRRMAPVRSLLLPCDLSEASKAAFVSAYGLLMGGGRVELCYVHEHGRPDLLAGRAEGADLTNDERASIEADLRSAIPAEGAEHGIATHVFVIEARSATDAILAAAERLDVDVIALASHGRSGLSRALLGSVAEQVSRRSPRPVFIVHGGPVKR